MPVGKMWIYRLLFVCVFACLFLCVCTVPDFEYLSSNSVIISRQKDRQTRRNLSLAKLKLTVDYSLPTTMAVAVYS